MANLNAPPSQMPVPGPMGPDAGAPVEAGMITPQQPAGEMAAADVNVKMAMDVLSAQLPVFGAGTEKGKALLDVLKKLGSTFGVDASKNSGAVPAEIAALLGALPSGAPGAPPSPPIAGGPPVPPPPPPGV
jgi:hypothetical protein